MDTIRICFLVGFVILGLNTKANSHGVSKRSTRTCVHTHEFRCDPPHFQCVNRHKLCDGIIHCNDHSDESVAVCDALIKEPCPPGYWKCGYGACIHAKNHCDGRSDCWDLSDEYGCMTAAENMEDIDKWGDNSPEPYTPPTTVATTTQAIPLQTTSSPPPQPSAPQNTNGNRRNGACIVPADSMGRQFTTFTTQIINVDPGSYIEHSGLLIVTCPAELQFDTDDEVRQFITTCTNGSWDQEIPKCLRACPKLLPSSVNLNMQCFGPRECDGECNGECDGPMSSGTKVMFKCKEFWDFSGVTNNQLQQISCKNDGKWSGEVPECVPRCGVSKMDIFNPGASAQIGHFPWLAGIYRVAQSKTTPSCTGTLVSLRVVVTAAHCMTLSLNDYSPVHNNTLRVALGKYYHNWDNTEKTEQRFKVESLKIHPDYHGSSNHWANDIALILLDRDVEVNAYVMPTCVDFKGRYSKGVVSDKMLLGYIAGWTCRGDTQPCEAQSEVLGYSLVPALSRDECSHFTSKIRNNNQNNRLTDDKYCVGNGTGSVIHAGVNGGGHTVPFLGEHYLFGVVSTVIGTSSGPVYGGLTNVTYHMQWLQMNIDTWSLARTQLSVDFRLKIKE